MHFLESSLNLARTYLCNGTRYQQSGENMSIYRDSLTYPQIWWNLVQKRLRTVDKVLPTPLNFLIFALADIASLTAWTLCNIQQANFGLQSIKQQNAGRAQDGLCHTSSCKCRAVYLDKVHTKLKRGTFKAKTDALSCNHSHKQTYPCKIYHVV